jgi:hypothetical protein
MDAVSFYGSVLAPVALRVLAVFKNGLGAPPTHYFYDTNEDLVQAALSYDSLKKNVYHGCATYRSNQSRKGDNAVAAKALWADMDVGPTKPYSTPQDAVRAVEKFRRDVGLMQPHYVSSGNGIHAYFSFDRPIDAVSWTKLAALFASCLNAAGVKHDSSRTQDIASILRVPGTHNYKSGTPLPVKLLAAGSDEAPAQILNKLKSWAALNAVVAISPTTPKQVAKENSELIGVSSYPPSEGGKIASLCPVLNNVAETGGDVNYEVWWRAIGVAKHTTEPEEVSIHWTRNRADTGHAKSDWRALSDSWAYGPTTCGEFAKHSDKCEACPYNGKIKSPIQLGVPELLPIEAVPQEPRDVGGGEWEFDAEWIKVAVQDRVKVSMHKGKLSYPITDSDGLQKHIAFCDRYWQVMRRVRGPDNVWQVEIAYAEYPGKPCKTFVIDSAAVTSNDLFRKEFSAHELHIYGPRGLYYAMSKAQYEQDLLYQMEDETAIYPIMGWATENNTPRGTPTGEFVLGSTIFRPKQPPAEIQLSDTVPTDLRSDFRVAGTVERWSTIIDNVYNRPKAEPYQFVIAAMFAAPLVPLVPGAGDWHGIPLALYGDSGAAKTTTALVGMSIYGPPQLLRFNANSDSKNGGQGDTVNAFALKVGTLQNVPFIADEMTGVDPEKMSAIMYMLANGKAKDRMAPNGTMVPNPYRWDVISIATGNDGFHAKLEQLRNKHTQEASMLRCFEVELRATDIKNVFPDIDRTYIEDTLLEQQHGTVGRKWLQFLVNNRLQISDLLAKRRATFKIDDDKSSLRFYKDLLLTVEVAAKLAKKCGFIAWDIDNMMAWARKQVGGLATSVFSDDWEGVISDFIASLHGRTIVTKNMRVGPGRRSGNKEMPLEPMSTSIPPVARRALDDKVFVVAASAVLDWAKERRITGRDLIGRMWALGYLTGPSVAPRIINIGAGSTVARPQAPCYELNYDKCVDAMGRDEVADDTNVVAFPNAAIAGIVSAVEEAVTSG